LNRSNVESVDTHYGLAPRAVTTRLSMSADGPSTGNGGYCLCANAHTAAVIVIVLLVVEEEERSTSTTTSIRRRQ